MEKRTLLFLRFFLILAIILVMAYSKKGLHFLKPGYLIALIYFGSNLLLYRMPESKFSDSRVSFLIFLFDIIAISAAIYFSQGFETDFYLIYFLAIFITSVNQDIGGSLPIAVVASIFYGWMVYRSSPGISILDPKILIKIPFLLMISLIGTYWASSTKNALKKKEELERFNIALKREIDRISAEDIKMRTFTENILNSVSSGVMATDKIGLITALNPEAELVLGLKKEETIGSHLKNIKGLEDFWKKIEQSINSGIPVKRDEVMIKNKNNLTIPIGLSISPIAGTKEEVSGCVVIFKDLSDIKAWEEKLKHNERLSYLGKMASWVAHEIRNPLTAIDGFAQLLASCMKPDKIKLYSSEINKGTQRINKMIDDILAFARTKRQVKYVDIDLMNLINSITKSIMGIKLEISNETSPVVEGDRESIRRVFINLINNSIEAMDENGKLQIRFFKDGEWIISEIKDNGKGISEEDMKNLFTPFFTTKERGTGLGLSIVKKTIEEHNGKITIHSEKDIGTVCRVYLPQKKEV